MGRTNGPSRPAEVGITAVLLLLDVLVVGWLLLDLGLTVWADGKSGGAPSAPGTARRTAWCLLGAAAVTGFGLLALRCRIAGVVQLLVLGGSAVLFAGAALE